VIGGPDYIPPRIVGTKYAVSGVLSRATNGVIRLSGEHTSIQRLVEIVILDPAVAADGPEADWLKKHARTLGAASHPSLQSLLDSGMDPGGRPYLVFEAPSGDTVTALLTREGPLAPARAGHIVLQVLEAVRALHRARVVMRGLAPEMVMIARRGDDDVVKLRHLFSAASFSDEHPDPVPFSPWVAPEVRRGEAGLDVTVDVFSVGALLRQLLVGAPGAGRLTPGSEPRSLASLPDTARRALSRSLAENPDERFPTVEVFMQAVALLAPSDLRPARDEMPLPADPLVADLHYLMLRRGTRHGTRAMGPKGEARAHLIPVLLVIEAVYRLLGTEHWAALVDAVPEVESLLPGAGNTPLHMASGVPTATLAKILSAADDIGGVGDLGLIPMLAHQVVERGLHRAFPALPARLSPESLIEGFPYLWSQVQWQGTPSVADREDRSARLIVRYQTEPQLEVSGFVAALLRAALRSVGARDAEVSITAAEALGDQADVYRARW
jgi:hypothetical protein